MIRAILDHGVIRPIEEIPSEWRDGQEVRVSLSDSGEHDLDRDELERVWQERLNSAGGITAEDHRLMQAALDEQRKIGKELMRREMETRP